MIQSQGLAAPYWHSANDKMSEGCVSHRMLSNTFLLGVWRQYDGTLLSWTPWWSTLTDEPDGGRAQNCGGVTLSQEEHAGKWFSHWCTELMYYICERGF